MEGTLVEWPERQPMGSGWAGRRIITILAPPAVQSGEAFCYVDRREDVRGRRLQTPCVFG